MRVGNIKLLKKTSNIKINKHRKLDAWEVNKNIKRNAKLLKIRKIKII